MKLSVNVKAGAISVLALNVGRIAVDIDGIELSELVATVNQNGGVLRVSSERDNDTDANPLPPFTSLPGMCCEYRTSRLKTIRCCMPCRISTRILASEWLHFTGSGYLLR